MASASSIIGLQNFRRQIGTVMQEDVLLTGSPGRQHCLLRRHAPTTSACRPVPQLAQLHDDIAKMPMGYQTLVGDLGSRLERGAKAAACCWPARSTRHPKVLALDEATSHLDLGNERAVTAALSQMPLTRLIIAHRPETIAGAQRVVQVRDGQVGDVLRSVGAAAEVA